MLDLAAHGPMKPSEEQGIDEIKEQYEEAVIEKGEFYSADPNGCRNGNGVGPQLSDTFQQVVRDAEAGLSPDLARKRQAVKIEDLKEKLETMRGAVMMAFPMGLPEFDIVALALESADGLAGTSVGNSVLDAETATLWCAGREFQRGEFVKDRVGRNEKTKVICKLQRPGGGAPGREPGISEDERKAMMAHYFKKQEEMKRLAEADDDEYLHSSWADPKQLQKSLRGMTAIRAPGLH